MDELIQVVYCPKCSSNLELLDQLVCCECSSKYQIINGVVVLADESRGQGHLYDNIYEDIIHEFDIEKSSILVNENYVNDIKKLNLDNKVVFDMGGGLGLISQELSESKLVIVVDLSLSALVDLNNRKNENMILVCGDIEKDFLKLKADIIICVAVLEHLKNPDIVLKRFNSMLNDGGMLYLQVPVCNLPFSNFFINVFRKIKGIDSETANDVHLTSYSTNGILKSLKESNFNIESVKYSSVLREFNLPYSLKLFDKKLAAGCVIVAKKSSGI